MPLSLEPLILVWKTRGCRVSHALHIIQLSESPAPISEVLEEVRRTLTDIVPIMIATTVSGRDWRWQGTSRDRATSLSRPAEVCNLLVTCEGCDRDVVMPTSVTDSAKALRPEAWGLGARMQKMLGPG